MRTRKNRNSSRRRLVGGDPKGKAILPALRLNIVKQLPDKKVTELSKKAIQNLKKQNLPTIPLVKMKEFIKRILKSGGKESLLKKLHNYMEKIKKSGTGAKSAAVKKVEVTVSKISSAAKAKGDNDTKTIKKAASKVNTMVKGNPSKKKSVLSAVLMGIIHRKGKKTRGKKTRGKKTRGKKTRGKKKGGGRRKGRFTKRAGALEGLGDFAKKERVVKSWQLGAMGALAAAGVASAIMLATGDFTFSPGDIVPDAAGEDYVDREWADAEFDEMTKGMSESEITRRFGPNAEEDWYAFRDDEGYSLTKSTADGEVGWEEKQPEGFEDAWGKDMKHPDQTPDADTGEITLQSKEDAWKTLGDGDSEFGRFYKQQQEKIVRADVAAARD